MYSHVMCCLDRVPAVLKAKPELASVEEYAYGPAQGLPETKVGAFTQVLYDETRKQGGHRHEERLGAHLRVRAGETSQVGIGRGGSLNAAGIDYNSIQTMQAMKRLMERDSLSPPCN